MIWIWLTHLHSSGESLPVILAALHSYSSESFGFPRPIPQADGRDGIRPHVVRWGEWQGQRVACLCHILKLSARTFADSIVGDPACLRMKATVQFFPMADISRSLFKYRAAS
jgi:hypothetical protein